MTAARTDREGARRGRDPSFGSSGGCHRRWNRNRRRRRRAPARWRPPISTPGKSGVSFSEQTEDDEEEDDGGRPRRYAVAFGRFQRCVRKRMLRRSLFIVEDYYFVSAAK